MENEQKKIEDFFNLMGKIGRLYATRILEAQKTFLGYMQKIALDQKPVEGAIPDNPWQAWTSYMTDAAQRSVLFWDIMRERGNNFIQHIKAGMPPLLSFEWEMISDGRKFDRPVNYALVRIIPGGGEG